MPDQSSLFGSDITPTSNKNMSAASAPTSSAGEPLAARMRPRTLDEILGQEQLLAPGRVLRRSIEEDHIPSMILWGPPGSGKTTLAEVIARQTHTHFVTLSAVSAGVADLRKVVEDARKLRQFTKQRTIMFIDEIHRFNKAQQDAVLQLAITIDDDALHQIAVFANGDARTALNVLELAAQGGGEASRENVPIHITLATVEDAMQHRALLYDKGGDQHYDTISALHKALRGSDPDAGLYWLGRMLEAGEDPLYIVRRLIRFASEDVGMADPQALLVCVAAQQAVHFVGLPEANLALAQAVVHLATAPKSNALYEAYSRVQEDVQKTRNDPVPLWIRNAPTQLMKDLDYGKDYKYAHEYYKEMQIEDPERPPAMQLQEYLPESLKGRRYYEPGQQGKEAGIKKWLEKRRGEDGTSSRDTAGKTFRKVDSNG